MIGLTAALRRGLDTWRDSAWSLNHVGMNDSRPIGSNGIRSERPDGATSPARSGQETRVRIPGEAREFQILSGPSDDQSDGPDLPKLKLVRAGAKDKCKDTYIERWSYPHLPMWKSSKPLDIDPKVNIQPRKSLEEIRAVGIEMSGLSYTMEVDPINDWELTTASNTINIVLVGRTGNGKSATGNSILGREAFIFDAGCFLVTRFSELQRTILNDDRIVNVIDTPGLFDCCTSAEVISGEIVKCMNLVKDGIHAVLMVLSLRSKFSIGEEATFKSIKSLFGDKIVDYMILVFTNGDILESKKKSLKDYISHFPEYLRNIIQLCKNRVIVFDNTTKDMIKREEQVNELLSLVESVIVDNGGKPYLNKIFAKHKEGALLRHQKVKEVEAK
ncbi:immune-associated nucleotide-binding protein 9-like [Dendrobium catenatum]|uniref:immune-associated nucleotide-binding protein 9-like n=1 Tax=Dendrobium catenatum TaxID=906689 RepID=UPI0009F22533|nr:immune-associated nucleotide-binding protein 9-like [Dendrobium catenatum]